MAKRARLIYNPTSGREELKRRLPDILMRLERGGLETSTHATTEKGDAIRAAAEAVARGFDIVIAAGGDGTLNEVINGIAEKEHRPALGILPLGTTNDFARAIGIPRNWKGACDIITRQHTQLIDVGKVNEGYFINIAAGGSLTELTYEVPSKLKTLVGQLAYYMKGLEKLPWVRPIELNLQSEEVTLHEKVMLFLIANGNSIGGMDKLVPEARLDDGLLDVLVLKNCNFGEFIRIATMALRGERIKDPHVVQFQTRRLKVTSEDYVQVNLDGELGGTLPCEYTVLSAHLRIIIDESAKPSNSRKTGVH